MPLRISLPCGVTLRRSFIVKMYCGAMRPFASLADGALRAQCVVVKQPILPRPRGGALRWTCVPQAPALRRRPPADGEDPCRAVRGGVAGKAVGTLSGLDPRTARAAPAPRAWRARA